MFSVLFLLFYFSWFLIITARVAVSLGNGLVFLIGRSISNQTLRRQLKKVVEILFLEKSAARRIRQDSVSHELLEDLPVVDLLFDCLLRHEPVDLYVTGLPDSQGPLGCLKIDHWVPVGVKDDDLVGGSQIDPERAHSSRKQKDREIFSVDCMELLNQFHALLHIDITVEAQELHRFGAEHVFYYI